jgi:hypothetical protein
MGTVVLRSHCDEIICQLFADFRACSARQSGLGGLAIAPDRTVKAVIMVIDLTEYFFDFHQSLDVTLFHVSHPVAR